MTTKNYFPLERGELLEKKAGRIEGLLWYIAGAMSINFGRELIPIISAWLGL